MLIGEKSKIGSSLLKCQMLFNPTKCDFLHIINRKNPFIHNYHFGSSTIQEVTSIKYLGVQIDHKLTWNDHIQYITHKASQINGFLYHNLSQCPPYVKTTCYKLMVYPILKYASSLWIRTQISTSKHLNLFKDV